MKKIAYCVAAICLLIIVTGVLGQADQQPKLPGQYAEVVLHVEGMT